MMRRGILKSPLSRSKSSSSVSLLFFFFSCLWLAFLYLLLIFLLTSWSPTAAHGPGGWRQLGLDNYGVVVEGLCPNTSSMRTNHCKNSRAKKKCKLCRRQVEVVTQYSDILVLLLYRQAQVQFFLSVSELSSLLITHYFELLLLVKITDCIVLGLFLKKEIWMLIRNKFTFIAAIIPNALIDTVCSQGHRSYQCCSVTLRKIPVWTYHSPVC